MQESQRKQDIYEKSKRLVLSLDEWSHWPVLPVKRGRELGIILALEGFYPSTVLIINIFSIPDGIKIVNIPDLASKKYVYESLDDLFLDGWKVD